MCVDEVREQRSRARRTVKIGKPFLSLSLSLSLFLSHLISPGTRNGTARGTRARRAPSRGPGRTSRTRRSRRRSASTRGLFFFWERREVEVSKAEESRWEQNECSLSLSLSAICSSFPVQLSAFWASSRSPLPIEESRGSRQPTREGGKSTALRFRLVDFRKIEGKRKKKLSTADVNSNNQTPKNRTHHA